jgi:hypothetical protein
MSKTQAAEAFKMTIQTLPFVMITALFILISYVYGHTLEPTSLVLHNWDYLFFTA